MSTYMRSIVYRVCMRELVLYCGDMGMGMGMMRWKVWMGVGGEIVGRSGCAVDVFVVFVAVYDGRWCGDCDGERGRGLENQWCSPWMHWGWGLWSLVFLVGVCGVYVVRCVRCRGTCRIGWRMHGRQSVRRIGRRFIERFWRWFISV